mgnify:CR=1 FL=1
MLTLLRFVFFEISEVKNLGRCATPSGWTETSLSKGIFSIRDSIINGTGTGRQNLTLSRLYSN